MTMHISRSIAVVMLCVATGTLAFAQDADAQLEKFFKQHLETSFRLRPVEATGLGDHRYDNQLDDISKEARTIWLKQTRATLKELPKQVEYKKLSRAGQVDYEILKQDLERDKIGRAHV